VCTYHWRLARTCLGRGRGAEGAGEDVERHQGIEGTNGEGTIMGEQIYTVEEQAIQFSESDDEWMCLCTFPRNDEGRLTRDRVASLALLGAAVVLAHNDELDIPILPHGVPQWIRDEIVRVVG